MENLGFIQLTGHLFFKILLHNDQKDLSFIEGAKMLF